MFFYNLGSAAEPNFFSNSTFYPKIGLERFFVHCWVEPAPPAFLTFESRLNSKKKKCVFGQIPYKFWCIASKAPPLAARPKPAGWVAGF